MRWSRAWLWLHHVGMIAVGVCGLWRGPSDTVAGVPQGPLLSLVWSAGLVVFGALALIARVRGARQAEAVATEAVGACLLGWGVVVAVGAHTTPQGGLALALAGAYTIGTSIGIIRSVEASRRRGAAVQRTLSDLEERP